MTDIHARNFVKRHGVLVPADFMADEMLSAVPERREVMLTLRRPRNPRHHRLLWALLRKATENSEQWESDQILLDELKLATGLAEVRVNMLTKRPYAVPGSVSFAAMDQTRFSAWFEQAIAILAREIGVSNAELWTEIEMLMERGDGLRRAA